MLALSDEVPLLFSELHNFPRHFKPRDAGISVWFTKKCKLDARSPGSCASPQPSRLLIVFSSHYPAKEIKGDVFK